MAAGMIGPIGRFAGIHFESSNSFPDKMEGGTCTIDLQTGRASIESCKEAKGVYSLANWHPIEDRAVVLSL